jgi:hypothetical protein
MPNFIPENELTVHDIYRGIHAEIQRGLSLADAEEPPAGPPAGPATGGQRAVAQTPALAGSLRTGRMAPGIDPADPDIQQLAAVFWRVEPPTLWILALSLNEGHAFAFRPALDRHLREDSGHSTRILLRSKLVQGLAKLVRLGQATASLPERLLAWEINTQRALVALPGTAFGDAEEPAAIDVARFEDGLEVRLGPVQHTAILVRQPEVAGNQLLDLHLVGASGAHRRETVSLHAQGGYADLGDTDALAAHLGDTLVAITAKEPPPPELLDN